MNSAGILPGYHVLHRRWQPGAFEQADKLEGARLDDLVIQPGEVLGERPVTLDGIGQTIEVTAARA